MLDDVDYTIQCQVGNACLLQSMILRAVLYKHLKSHFVYAIHLSLEFSHTLMVNPHELK